MKRVAWALVGLLSLSAGCWNYRNQLDRAEEHYRAGRYEAAVTNLDDLEDNLDVFNRDERARYGALRGMSHSHLGHRAHARHWLAVTREMLEAGAVIPESDRTEALRTLTELDWVTPVREGNNAHEAAANTVPSGTEPADTTVPTTPAPAERSR